MSNIVRTNIVSIENLKHHSYNDRRKSQHSQAQRSGRVKCLLQIQIQIYIDIDIYIYIYIILFPHGRVIKFVLFCAFNHFFVIHGYDENMSIFMQTTHKYTQKTIHAGTYWIAGTAEQPAPPHSRCHSGFAPPPPRIWSGRIISACGFGPNCKLKNVKYACKHQI